MPISAHGAPSVPGSDPPIVIQRQARAGWPAQIEVESNGLRARITLSSGPSQDHQSAAAFNLSGQALNQAAAAALGYETSRRPG